MKKVYESPVITFYPLDLQDVLSTSIIGSLSGLSDEWDFEDVFGS